MAQGAMEPPLGMEPDFEHPEDVLKTVIIVTQALCIPICSLFVFVRFFVKFKMKSAMGIEDGEL